MKLILCKSCHDVIRLQVNEIRYCKCGECSGKYERDGLKAWYKGKKAVPIGFDNPSLVKAFTNQPLEGVGERFEAFVIPKICPTMKKKE